MFTGGIQTNKPTAFLQLFEHQGMQGLIAKGPDIFDIISVKILCCILILKLLMTASERFLTPFTSWTLFSSHSFAAFLH